MNNFDIKKFLVENKLTFNSAQVANEVETTAEDTPVTEQPTQNEVSKYLKHESAQAILLELENEIALAGLDLRKEQIQKIIQEIESKISTLEEDAGMQGFVDKAAINEKRKVVKELNKAYEKVNKLSEKMHAKRKKKMK